MLYRNSLKTVVWSLGIAGVVFNPVFAFAGLTVEPLPGYETMHEECTSEGYFRALVLDGSELWCETEHCFVWLENGEFREVSSRLKICEQRPIAPLELAGPEATFDGLEIFNIEPEASIGE